MPDFTKGFQTDEGYFELSFSKIENFTANKYFVAIHKANEFIAGFDMKQNAAGEWEVIEPAPACIVEAGPKLAKLVESFTIKTGVYLLLALLAM